MTEANRTKDRSFAPFSEGFVMESFGCPRVRVKVLSAKISPLNPRQWSLSLACGHEKWVTAKRKPAAKTAYCAKCAESRCVICWPDDEENYGQQGDPRD